ncbi:hypothetical protein DH2020_025058 [Rehmannia glutinosa]|uniref:Uncharacterized protein n=1 Tax=Rehmannia glutinosa TaxID=99300 RepID=A0ABR0W378_REHGL
MEEILCKLPGKFLKRSVVFRNLGKAILNLRTSLRKKTPQYCLLKAWFHLFLWKMERIVNQLNSSVNCKGLVIGALIRLKCLSSDVVEIISILQTVSKDLVEDVEFVMVGNVAKGFLCSTALPGGVRRSDDGMKGSESQQNEAFWSKPENIAAIEAIESAFLKRDEFKKWCDEAQNFSLGLTQDTNVGRWDDILDTSRHYEKSVKKVGHVRDGGMASMEAGVHDSKIGGSGGHDALLSEKSKTDVETEVGGMKPGGSGEVKGKRDIALERSKKVFSRRAAMKTKKSVALSLPFVARQIDVSSKPNQNEKMITKWLFVNPGMGNPGDDLDGNTVYESFVRGLDTELGDPSSDKLNNFDMVSTVLNCVVRLPSLDVTVKPGKEMQNFIDKRGLFPSVWGNIVCQLVFMS